jgi:hypothetical protein
MLEGEDKHASGWPLVLHGISFGPHSKSLRVRLIIKGLQ